MLLYILRHGETVWNAERRVQGLLGSDLSEKGVTLAQTTRAGLLDVPFDLCITSPLLRARHTAELVLAGRDVPIIEDERIREISFGAWEGMILAGPRAEVPMDRWMRFIEDPFAFEPPEGAETIRDVIARTGDFLTELTADGTRRDQTILLSTHGCAARALLNAVYEDKADFWHGKVPPNCSVSIVRADSGKLELLEEDHLFYDAVAWGVPASGWVELE